MTRKCARNLILCSSSSYFVEERNPNTHTKQFIILSTEPINSPNNSHSSSIREEILSPRSSQNIAMTPRRRLNAPQDNLPIQPIEIDTHVHFNGTAPLTNSSASSTSTDDSNYGFVKSPRLSHRNPVTGTGVPDGFHRGRRMDGRRGITNVEN